MPHLFSPLAVGPIELPNRIAVAPMCQYSASDGSATDWHLQHLMQFAIVARGHGGGRGHRRWSAAGRITHGCLGLYSDANEAALARVLDAGAARGGAGHVLCHPARPCRAQSLLPAPVGRRQAAAAGEDPWPTVAPSAFPFAGRMARPPRPSTRRASRASAARSARRPSGPCGSASTPSSCTWRTAICCTSSSRRSPTSRSDGYGGSMPRTACAFPLEVTRAVRARGADAPSRWARASPARDWADGGLTADDAVAFAAALKAAGLDYVCVSGGGAVPHVKVPLAPGYQVPMAAKVKAATGLVTRAVGMIVDAGAGRGIIASGRPTSSRMARAFLDDPRWVWHAAERLGAEHRLSAAVRPRSPVATGPARPSCGPRRCRRLSRRDRWSAARSRRRRPLRASE